MSELDSFRTCAEDFCAVRDDAASVENVKFRRAVQRALALVFAAAVELPDVVPATSQPLEADGDGLPSGVVEAAGDWYWGVERVASPDHTPEPMLGDLAEGLAEIRHDLQPILQASPGTATADLGWQARFDVVSHWGAHALAALRVLHASPEEGRRP